MSIAMLFKKASGANALVGIESVILVAGAEESAESKLFKPPYGYDRVEMSPTTPPVG
jgi:hypothetical protein